MDFKMTFILSANFMYTNLFDKEVQKSDILSLFLKITIGYFWIFCNIQYLSIKYA